MKWLSILALLVLILAAGALPALAITEVSWTERTTPTSVS